MSNISFTVERDSSLTISGVPFHKVPVEKTVKRKKDGVEFLIKEHTNIFKDIAVIDGKPVIITIAINPPRS